MEATVRRNWKSLVFPTLLLVFAVGTVESQSYALRHGPGGSWTPGFVERTLIVPCHATVVATVSAARFDHWADDFQITVEFRKPGVAVSASPSAVNYLWSKPEDRSIKTFTVPGHDSGCGTAWNVRLVPAATTRETNISGDFNVSFKNTVATMSVEDAAILANGRSTTKNIGPSSGLHQGWVEITGTWNHSVFGVPGPLPVKLTFALVKPSGDIAAFDSGHSNHEVNPFVSGDKLKLRFRVPVNINGQWKLRITNDSGQDAMTIIPKAIFKPSCS